MRIDVKPTTRRAARMPDRPRNRMAKVEGSWTWQAGAAGYFGWLVFNVCVAAVSLWEMVQLPAFSETWWAAAVLVLWPSGTALSMLVMDREAVRVEEELADLWPGGEDEA